MRARAYAYEGSPGGATGIAANPPQVIRGAITVAVLVAAFVGLVRVGAVHGEMCLSQVGCVHAAKDEAKFQRSPTPAVVKQAREHRLVVPAG
jgi:hypothetical protein